MVIMMTGTATTMVSNMVMMNDDSDDVWVEFSGDYDAVNDSFMNGMVLVMNSMDVDGFSLR